VTDSEVIDARGQLFRASQRQPSAPFARCGLPIPSFDAARMDQQQRFISSGVGVVVGIG
jgi:hypothetical protein